MKIDLQELRSRKEYIREQQHPSLPLIIWNYTHRAQFDRVWDEYTTQARGLITDLEGNIVARPFPKFFNLQEHEGEALPDLPTHKPQVFEKLDGSLGVQYWAGDHWGIATRGSFTSDQSVWATEWFKSMDDKAFLTGYTYLWEIIYDANRIVVNYDIEGLVLLAVRNTLTGEELDLEEEANRLEVLYAKPLDKTPEELLEMAKTLDGNQEGWVLKYSDTFRVKVKGAEYVRLHRLLTGFSTTSIWEVLANGENLDDLLERVPDEFYQWVRQTKEELEIAFMNEEREAYEGYELVKDLPDRKSQAVVVQKMRNAGLVFGLLDGKDIAPRIWKMIKPKFAKPFKQDEI